MLTKVRKATTLITPVGYKENPKNDFWLHMTFSFNAKNSSVQVDNFWITDGAGTSINLSNLTYNAVQFISETMAEEFHYHSELYYFELETIHYERCG